MNWPLTYSTPERAILELLDELPDRETFHQVDMLVEGLFSLSPRRLQNLLKLCTSVKVKRLFFFADRHQHAWLKHINKDAIELGSGNRVLVKGGRLDKRYRITVPGTSMAFRESYRKQVELLLRALPHVAEEKDFALEGGTAINLFVRNFRRGLRSPRQFERPPERPPLQAWAQWRGAARWPAAS